MTAVLIHILNNSAHPCTIIHLSLLFFINHWYRVTWKNLNNSADESIFVWITVYIIYRELPEEILSIHLLNQFLPWILPLSFTEIYLKKSYLFSCWINFCLHYRLYHLQRVTWRNLLIQLLNQFLPGLLSLLGPAWLLHSASCGTCLPSDQQLCAKFSAFPPVEPDPMSPELQWPLLCLFAQCPIVKKHTHTKKKL